MVLAVLAFLGIGWLVRRNGHELFQRMGLKRVTALQLLIGAAIIVILVVFQAIVGLVWALINPEQAELLENVNTLLLGDIDTIWEWFLLALAAGLGEELLFRGALQPVLGLGFTAVLFGLVHVQYGFSPIILFLILLAVILGIIRQRYSTTLAIIIHFGYDFTLGLLALLAIYLERFVA
jgi:membrane protease YdiL (CAAX protease family)